MKTFLLTSIIIILFQSCNYSQSDFTLSKSNRTTSILENKDNFFMYYKDTIQNVLTDIDKLILYEEGRKTKTTAVVLSLILPGLGHVYTRNYLTGLGFFAGVFGAEAIAVTQGIENGNLKAGFWIGSAIALIGRIWDIVDACNKVNQLNRDLYQRVFNKPKPELTKTLVPFQNNNLFSYSINF